MKRYKNIRQGQTRWKVVVYEPGQIKCPYPDVHVGVVYPCFVTETRSKSLSYTAGHDGFYIAGREWFFKNTYPTYRKALAGAMRQLQQIEKELRESDQPDPVE